MKASFASEKESKEKRQKSLANLGQTKKFTYYSSIKKIIFKKEEEGGNVSKCQSRNLIEQPPFFLLGELLLFWEIKIDK